MHRIDGPNAVAGPHSYGPVGPNPDSVFTDGNPTSAQEATDVSSDFLNDLVENVISPMDRAGLAPAKGIEDQLADALEILSLRANGGRPIGRWEYVSASACQIVAPMFQPAARLEMPGALLTLPDPFTFDLTADFEGTEAASSALYFYVENSGGTAVPHVSHQRPSLRGDVLTGQQKLGYHPTNTGWRCVGTDWNDAAADLIPSTYRGGVRRFDQVAADHVDDLGTAYRNNGWQDLVLSIPDGAIRVDLLAHVETEGMVFVVGRSDATQAPPGIEAVPYVAFSDARMRDVADAMSAGVNNFDDYRYAPMRVGIANPDAPAIRYAGFGPNSTPIIASEMRTLGYSDPFGPIE